MPSIGELCRDPVETRARAATGLSVPCYRCIAWTGTDCQFLTNPPRAAEKGTPDKGDQLTAFPTSSILNSPHRRP